MKSLRKSLLAVSITVAASSSIAQAEELVFAHGANPGNPRYDAAEMFAAIVPSCSDLTVNHAPSATMGNDAEMLTSAQAGVIQMSANSQGAFAQIVPEVGMLGLPFLFKDEPAVWRVVDGPVGDALDKKAQEAGLKIVTFWDNGFRNVTHTDKFVSKPADVEGMKIRTPPDQVTIDIFKALGANPAPLAWSELPTALRSGTFDGQENPLTNIYSAKLHEITPYISMTGHKYESTPVVAGLGWWNSLSEDDQACITAAAKQAGWYQRGSNMLANKKLQSVMEDEGAKFTTVDREALMKATASVYDKYEEELGGFVSDLRAAAK
ncbi:TRAP transporter substrate-binding protein [Marinobacterium aestuariivivens]|uniref:TRAP transporter substrate-binding protein n=1 Tax=Marinobacterium aestuariivivens TaxID=1698799 RepID=A0ABW2A0Y8_9GAMM